MRITVKVGTSTLAHATGRLNIQRMEGLCKVLSDLKNAGHEIILVSSGAIGMGVGKLNLPGRPKDMPTKQAAAAVGQCELMYTYDRLFGQYNHTVAQMLLTWEDFDHETRLHNLRNTLERLLELGPENITVHTLTLKRASRIVIEDQKENDYADVAAMLEKCHLLAEAGYRPYYLYRQKNTLQNLENVGWCKPGHEGYYNIYIMEEVQTILSAGAGGSTKLVADGGKRMQRIFNFKYPNEYIQRFAEVLERKKGVADFYDHDLGPEASG